MSRGLSEEECVEKVMGSLIAGWRAKNLEEIVWEEKKQEESAVEKMAAPAKKVSMFDAAFEDDGEKKMRNTVLKYYEDIAQRHKGKAAKVAARMKRKNSARASLKKVRLLRFGPSVHHYLHCSLSLSLTHTHTSTIGVNIATSTTTAQVNYRSCSRK